jgi:hypothetical protein
MIFPPTLTESFVVILVPVFWQESDSNFMFSQNKMSIAAGTLDSGHGLKIIGHIYVLEAGEYYEIKDELPQFDASSNGQLESK